MPFLGGLSTPLDAVSVVALGRDREGHWRSELSNPWNEPRHEEEASHNCSGHVGMLSSSGTRRASQTCKSGLIVFDLELADERGAGWKLRNFFLSRRKEFVVRLLASLRVLVDALDLGQKISSSVTLPSPAKHCSFFNTGFWAAPTGGVGMIRSAAPSTSLACMIYV